MAKRRDMATYCGGHATTDNAPAATITASPAQDAITTAVFYARCMMALDAVPLQQQAHRHERPNDRSLQITNDPVLIVSAAGCYHCVCRKSSELCDKTTMLLECR